MGTTTPPHGINGVGQHGFIARHGLYSDEQAAAADEVAARIRELGLRTVRLIVVDQHGVPRSKSLSSDVAIAAMSNGLDFSARSTASTPATRCSFLPSRQAAASGSTS